MKGGCHLALRPLGKLFERGCLCDDVARHAEECFCCKPLGIPESRCSPVPLPLVDKSQLHAFDRVCLEVVCDRLFLVLHHNSGFVHSRDFQVLKNEPKYGLPGKLYHALGPGIGERPQPLPLPGCEHNRLSYSHIGIRGN